MSDSADTEQDEQEQPMDDPVTSTTVAAPAATTDEDGAPDDVDNEEIEEENGDSGNRNVLAYLEWAGLGLCVVLVLVAGLRVYWGVGAFISLWVASKYEPIVSAGFNLAVLLLAAYGIAVLSRRVTATS